MSSLNLLNRFFIIIEILKGTKRPIQGKDLLDRVNVELKGRGGHPISMSTLDRSIRELRASPYNLNIVNEGKSGYQLMPNGYDGWDVMQLIEPFHVLNTLQFSTGLSDILIPEPFTEKGTNWLYPLIQAIREKKQVKITYVKHDSLVSDERTVDPIVLKQMKGLWYLIGFDYSKNEVRTFGLDRISNIEVTSRRSAKDLAVDLEDKFKHSYGIYSSDQYPIKEVVLKFNSQDGNYLKSNPVHHSQEILTDTPDVFRIKLVLRITEDFVMALMARGWSVEVEQPIALRNRLSSIFKEAHERNG